MAEKLAGGNVLALLCNTILTGVILVVLISLFRPISGAQFNPAMTSVPMRRGINVPDALAYVAALLVGATVGAWWCASDVRPADPNVGRHGTLGWQWVDKAIATFGLVITILACVRCRPKGVATMVGLYITAAYWFISSTAFANPAVTVARALADSFAGIRPADVPAFILAQLTYSRS